MTINGFKYFPFTLRLKFPFQSSTQIITERNGFIVMAEDENGNASYGECSPLPGFSSENIEDARRILEGLQHQIIGFSCEENLSAVSELLSDFKLVPSLQFALEQAMIGLFSIRNGAFLSNTFGVSIREFPVNAVEGFGNEENIVNRISDKLNKGFKTFKIKIGRDDFESDYQIIQNIRNEFGSGINLRLDANRKWTYPEAKAYAEKLSPFDIEYIEEPCTTLNESLRLAQDPVIPIALDESLSSVGEAMRVLDESNINFVVLKPMVYSGIISSRRIIQHAGKMNKKIIISSTFESVIGKSALALLAASANHSLAHGLDTSDYFIQNLSKDTFNVKNGKILFEKDDYPPQFDFQLQ